MISSAQAYQRLVGAAFPRKATWRRAICRAYWRRRRLICALGQAINDLFAIRAEMGRAERRDRDEHLPGFCCPSLLTGLGVYDKIGKYAGAGSIVPITGFANSVVAPAMEFRTRGAGDGRGREALYARRPRADLRHRRLDRRRAGGAGHGRGAISRAEDCGHFAARAA